MYSFSSSSSMYATSPALGTPSYTSASGRHLEPLKDSEDTLRDSAIMSPPDVPFVSAFTNPLDAAPPPQPKARPVVDSKPLRYACLFFFKFVRSVSLLLIRVKNSAFDHSLQSCTVSQPRLESKAAMALKPSSLWPKESAHAMSESLLASVTGCPGRHS